MRKRLPNYRLVVGFTGPIASGKGLAVEAVQEMFEGQEPVRSILLSDYIREVVLAEGKPLTRDTLLAAGNARRKEKGPGAWVERMFEDLPDIEGGVLLVDSIRNPGEIEALRRVFEGRVLIVATEAPLQDRVERVLKRAREEDATIRAEIVRQMEIEMEHNPEFGFALDLCREMADYVAPSRKSKAEKIAEMQREVRVLIEQMERREAAIERRRAA